MNGNSDEDAFPHIELPWEPLEDEYVDYSDQGHDDPKVRFADASARDALPEEPTTVGDTVKVLISPYCSAILASAGSIPLRSA